MKYFLTVITFINVSLLAGENNSLLWEISGKGLNKPSYLYGTIHSNQDRFFDMGDSVFTALESTESFAGELDMDSLPYFAGKIADGLKNTTDIPNLLNDEELNRLKIIVKEKLGISYDDLPLKDPVLIVVLLEKDYFQGTMPFFVDEYLYKIAKAKNKNILGIETFDDQMNLFNELTDEDKKEMLLSIINEDSTKTRKMYNDLSDAYYNNDIEKLNELVSSEMKDNSDMESKFLIKRNYNMAARIAELIKTQSLFIAIGAAHLPGEEGVINLLRKEGYSLRPVKVIRTGTAKKYLDEMTGQPWPVYSPADSGFLVEMPGTPSDIPVPAQIPGTKAEAVFYNDAGTGSVYIVIRYVHPEPLSAMKIDSLINNLTTAMSASGLKISGELKNITFEGMHGREINGEMMSYLSTARILFDKETMYWLQSLRPSNITDNTNADRFFNSFKVKKIN
jgi:uncharacterized protein YbaP (TraB family)